MVTCTEVFAVNFFWQNEIRHEERK